MGYCQMLLERGLEHGMWKLRISGSIRCSWLLKECRTNRWKFLSASRCSLIWGLNSTGGLSNNSNGMPKTIRPIMDSALVAMAMMQGSDLRYRKPE
ncbi:MAG: hypothetical protein ACLR2E_03710 [Lachnospiraceae bacterium]